MLKMAGKSTVSLSFSMYRHNESLSFANRLKSAVFLLEKHLDNFKKRLDLFLTEG